MIRPWKKQLAMWATYSRALAAPVIMLILLWPAYWTIWPASLIFMLASLTDWLDGYWARKYEAESTLGQLMDPIADKILVIGALVMLQDMDLVGPEMVFLLLARDVFVGGIRSVAASERMIISAKPFGKWKTALQMVGIPCLLLSKGLPHWYLQPIGFYLLWISVVLSLISGVQYSNAYFNAKKKQEGAAP